MVRRRPNKKVGEIDPARTLMGPEMRFVEALKASVITFILAGAATGLVQFALHLV